jgi:TPR repeat protein
MGWSQSTTIRFCCTVLPSICLAWAPLACGGALAAATDGEKRSLVPINGRPSDVAEAAEADAALEAGDYDKALPIIRRLANIGWAPIQHTLGVLYAEGKGVAQDDFAALEWFKRSAEQNFPDAQYNLGVFYASGRGTPQNDKLGMYWRLKAAENDFAQAQYSVGMDYLIGERTAVNKEKGLYWLRQGALQGHPESQMAVAAAYQGGNFAPLNLVKAYAWYSILRVNSSADLKELAEEELQKLRGKLTREQVDRAQAAATLCVESNSTNCP